MTGNRFGNFTPSSRLASCLLSFSAFSIFYSSTTWYHFGAWLVSLFLFLTGDSNLSLTPIYWEISFHWVWLEDYSIYEIPLHSSIYLFCRVFFSPWNLKMRFSVQSVLFIYTIPEIYSIYVKEFQKHTLHMHLHLLLLQFLVHLQGNLRSLFFFNGSIFW